MDYTRIQDMEDNATQCMAIQYAKCMNIICICIYTETDMWTCICMCLYICRVYGYIYTLYEHNHMRTLYRVTSSRSSIMDPRT